MASGVVFLLVALGAAIATIRWRQGKAARREGERVDRRVSKLWRDDELQGRIAKLDEMYASGWLSREEYYRQRAAIEEML